MRGKPAVRIQPSHLTEFLTRPPGEIRAVLVYGADRGLIGERVESLTKSVVEDLADPFRVARLAPAEIKEGPGRLADEAASLVLTGGRRVVLIQSGTEDLSKPLAAFLEAPPGDALIIVEGGELARRSAMCKLFEGAPNAATVACYPDDAGDIKRLIDESFRPGGIKIEPDARSYLIQNLGGDRLATRREVEKLLLYLGDEKELSLTDAIAAIGDGSAFSLEEVIHAAAGGERARLERELSRALIEGTAPVAILRALARHFMRLQLALRRMNAGKSADAAMKSLRPPVFFAFTDRFRAQLGQWQRRDPGRVLEWLMEAELACKSTGMPAEAICSRVLMRIAQEVHTRGPVKV